MIAIPLRFRLVLVLMALLVPTGTAAEALPPGAPLDLAFVETLVGNRLAAGAPARMVLTVREPRLPLGNTATIPTEVELQGFDLDAATGRIAGRLVGFASGAHRFTLQLRGQLIDLLEVPVPARSIARGERITGDHLTWIEMRSDRIQSDTATDAEALIGSEARRRLAPGRSVRLRDVRAPRLVERGRPVRLIYTTPGLEVLLHGIALDDGARGELVLVQNPDSRRRVEGLVTGPDQVHVGIMGAATPSAAPAKGGGRP